MSEYPDGWSAEQIEQYRKLKEGKWKAQPEQAAQQNEKVQVELKTKFKLKLKTQSVDPWETVLLHVEQRIAEPTGSHFIKAPDNSGKLEWRVMTDYILTRILEIPRERQHSGQSRRLGVVMRKLGWTGPINLRFDGPQARGYFKTCDR